MERRIALRLIHATTEQDLETVDVFLDPDHPETFPVLRRHFMAMAARAADERIEYRLEDMPWLHDYTLLVCEGHNHADVLMRYREG